MKVGSIITRSLVTFPSGGTLLEAAKEMVKHNIGLLVICDLKSGGRMLGVISERDIIRAIAAGVSPSTRVDEVSTKKVITVKVTDNVVEIAKAMNKHTIRHVVVVDEKDTPTGVVSMRDLVGERTTLTAILQSQEDVFAGGD